MSSHSLERNAIRKNLEDAGCSPEAMEQLMTLLDEGRKDQLLRALAMQRASFLESVHTEQKKVDRLDYLVYQLRKAEKEKAILKNQPVAT